MYLFYNVTSKKLDPINSFQSFIDISDYVPSVMAEDLMQFIQRGIRIQFVTARISRSYADYLKHYPWGFRNVWKVDTGTQSVTNLTIVTWRAVLECQRHLLTISSTPTLENFLSWTRNKQYAVSLVISFSPVARCYCCTPVAVVEWNRCLLPIEKLACNN